MHITPFALGVPWIHTPSISPSRGILTGSPMRCVSEPPHRTGGRRSSPQGRDSQQRRHRDTSELHGVSVLRLSMRAYSARKYCCGALPSYARDVAMRAMAPRVCFVPEIFIFSPPVYVLVCEERCSPALWKLFQCLCLPRHRHSSAAAALDSGK